MLRYINIQQNSARPNKLLPGFEFYLTEYKIDNSTKNKPLRLHFRGQILSL